MIGLAEAPERIESKHRHGHKTYTTRYVLKPNVLRIPRHARAQGPIICGMRFGARFAKVSV